MPEFDTPKKACEYVLRRCAESDLDVERLRAITEQSIDAFKELRGDATVEPKRLLVAKYRWAIRKDELEVLETVLHIGAGSLLFRLIKNPSVLVLAGAKTLVQVIGAIRNGAFISENQVLVLLALQCGNEPLTAEQVRDLIRAVRPDRGSLETADVASVLEGLLEVAISGGNRRALVRRTVDSRWVAEV